MEALFADKLRGEMVHLALWLQVAVRVYKIRTLHFYMNMNGRSYELPYRIFSKMIINYIVVKLYLFENMINNFFLTRLGFN
jgi:hypothetical protein